MDETLKTNEDMVTVRIVLSERRPPAGLVESAGSGAVTFSGWLGLLRALYDLVEIAPEPSLG